MNKIKFIDCPPQPVGERGRPAQSPRCSNREVANLYAVEIDGLVEGHVEIGRAVDVCCIDVYVVPAGD
jgi:hypothetical protein